MTERPEGWEIPCHRSLTEPILLGGVPKALAQYLWLLGLSIAMALHQLWVLPVFFALHLGCAAVTRWDPHFFQVFWRVYTSPKRLDP